MRTLALLTVLLSTSPAAALEVVLRDTIGPDGAATGDILSAYANTNQTEVAFASPGIRATNTAARAGVLSTIKSVLVVNEIGSASVNDLQRVNSISIQEWLASELVHAA